MYVILLIGALRGLADRAVSTVWCNAFAKALHLHGRKTDGIYETRLFSFRNPMKILMVSPIIGEAFGQERVMRDSARLLEGDGHQIYFLGERSESALNRNSFLVEGLTALNRFSGRGLAGRVLENVLRVADKVKPDVVHLIEQLDPRVMNALSERYATVLTAHTVAPTCPASGRFTREGACAEKSGWACFTKQRDKGCLSHFKNDFYRAHAIYEFERKRSATKKLRAIIANSRYTQSLLEREGFTPEQVQFVPNPVAVPVSSVREKQRVPLLVTTSRLHPLKGLGTLLSALSQLRKEAWELRICGDGPEKQKLLAQTREAGLEAKVHFLGQLPYEKAGELVSRATVLIQPNVGPETFGLSVAEASSSGIPVLTSNLPALNEIIEDGVNGLLCPPGNTAMLAERLLSLLHDERLRARLSEQGPLLMRQRFSPLVHLEATLAVYRDALQTSARAA